MHPPTQNEVRPRETPRDIEAASSARSHSGTYRSAYERNDEGKGRKGPRGRIDGARGRLGDASDLVEGERPDGGRAAGSGAAGRRGLEGIDSA